MNTATVAKISDWAVRLLAAMCVLVPFHALLTVLAGSTFGGYTGWRLWVEVLLIPLVLWTLWLLGRDRQLWAALRRSPLTWCLAAYVALHVLLGVWALATDRVNAAALVDGWALNLRLVVFFFVGQVLTTQSDWLRANWRKVILIPAAVVIGFGLLQIFVLPHDVLRHFGYGPQTIMPYEVIDQKSNYLRVQSTLRGANPLGAYLVLVLAALVAVGWRQRQPRVQGLLGMSLVATLTVLIYTYSRSAYIGAAVAVAATVWWGLRQRRAKQWLLLGAAGLLVIAASAAFSLRHNDRFQNTFFHTDEHSQAERSSNQDRAMSLQNGVNDLVLELEGRGPGTAGPASLHNREPARIAENYYLQIGQEVGVLGLGLFVAILILIGRELWRKRAEPLPRLLLASLLGISLINLLSHAWTDETLAVLWWSMAGVALAPSLAAKTKPTKSKGNKNRATA